MRKTLWPCAAAAAMAVGAIYPSAAQQQEDPGSPTLRAVTAVTGHALTGSRAIEYLQFLCDRIGARLTGSASDRDARSWAEAEMKRMGLENVHQEPFQMPAGWTRGHAYAKLVSPSPQRLTVDSLGWAGSTKAGGDTGAIVPIDRNRIREEAAAGSKDRWRGAFLFLRSSGGGAGEIDVLKQMGPFLRAAAEAGALGVITGSPSTEVFGMNLTHANLPAASAELHRIPVVNMAPESYALVSRLLAKAGGGEEVRIWMDVQNSVTSGPVPTGNVIGEIRGARTPDEIVLLCAHIDSWDLGQGATDDGFGTAAVLSAAESILRSGHRPARTIRFALFSGEEQGLKGSLAYVKSNSAGIPGHVAAISADMGDGPPRGLMTNGRPELAAPLREAAKVIGAGSRIRVAGGMYLLGDSFAFTLAGVPAIDLEQASVDNQRVRHSAADTFDKVKPENLDRVAATLASLAVWIAEQPARLAPMNTPAQVEALITKSELGGLADLFGATR